MRSTMQSCSQHTYRCIGCRTAVAASITYIFEAATCMQFPRSIIAWLCVRYIACTWHCSPAVNTPLGVLAAGVAWNICTPSCYMHAVSQAGSLHIKLYHGTVDAYGMQALVAQIVDAVIVCMHKCMFHMHVFQLIRTWNIILWMTLLLSHAGTFCKNSH